ncbi:MAG TPA: hypothetical protein VMZ74_03295 [Ramlibacter sp.]|nr:hypothetical protein [Ramlibacter sp.]
MRDVMLFLHLAAAILWMGGMAFMLLALRPSLTLVDPPQRVALMTSVLQRFFAVVAISIAVLLATGALLFADAAAVPRGWQAMALIGVLMMLVFGYIFLTPWRRFKLAGAASNWPAAGAAAAQIALLAQVNLGLGWIAIAAVLLWR